MSTQKKIVRWEALWSNYMAALRALDAARLAAGSKCRTRPLLSARAKARKARIAVERFSEELSA